MKDHDVIAIARQTAEVIIPWLQEKYDIHGTFHPTDGVRSRGDRIFFDLRVSNDYGIFKSIIRSARISVYMDRIHLTGKASQWWVEVSLDYEHHNGGRNGSCIGTIWLNDDLTLHAELTEEQRAADNKSYLEGVK